MCHATRGAPLPRAATTGVSWQEFGPRPGASTGVLQVLDPAARSEYWTAHCPCTWPQTAETRPPFPTAMSTSFTTSPPTCTGLVQLCPWCDVETKAVVALLPSSSRCQIAATSPAVSVAILGPYVSMPAGSPGSSEVGLPNVLVPAGRVAACGRWAG